MSISNSMLDFQMIMLKNIYSNDLSFRKELKKSKQWLTGTELVFLKKWLLNNFSTTHLDTIHEEFYDVCE